MNTQRWYSILLRQFSIPHGEYLSRLIQSLSPAERLLFYFFSLIFAASTLTLVYQVNNAFLVRVPAYGGTLREGVVGSPRFINPLLALSDADRDITMLVYSGLLKATPDGSLIPDLAEHYSVSQDGLVYTFFIRENAVFQDGTAVTADDVVFTIEKALDPSVKSPKRANWEGVEVRKVSNREVEFILKQPYAPFLQNATMGILPLHLWKNAAGDVFSFSKFNIEPVGSGPYQVTSVTRDNSGIPLTYELAPFDEYALGEPHIARIILRFYQSENALLSALKRGETESSSGISPEKLSSLEGNKYTILHAPLSRVFGVFFNQNQATIFTNTEVRKALDRAVDKDALVKSVLHGYGIPTQSPIPPGIISSVDEAVDTEGASAAENIERAKILLESGGWSIDPANGLWSKAGKTLQFSLATANSPELRSAAEGVASFWKALGIPTDVQVFEQGDLTQNVIRPRKYDALLFGEIIGRELDLFAFWHSSQRNDPGLNIAMYANITADNLLERARTSSDEKVQRETYALFLNEIADDTPAVFLYVPEFIYRVPSGLGGIRLGSVTTSSERFLNVQEWYLETDSVWSIFQ